MSDLWWVPYVGWSCAWLWVWLMWRDEGRSLKESRELLDECRAMREQHRAFFDAVRRGDPDPTRFLPPLQTDRRSE